MLRTALIGLVVHGLVAAAASAQGKMDCSAAHKSFLDKLERGNSGKITPERLAAQKRRAQRIYNACVTGDLEDGKALFERLDEGKY